MGINLQEIYEDFPDEESCLEYLMEFHYGGRRFKCPKCNRLSNFYRLKNHPAYSCQNCGHHIHPKAKGPFARSRAPLQHCLYILFLLWDSGDSISTKELQRVLGMSYKTARRMRKNVLTYIGELKGEEPD